jgi:predicted N-formylglutamate amidohydrolase
MMIAAIDKILKTGEPEPTELIGMNGTSPFVLICEHAGNRVPEGLANLGLSRDDLQRHIAWDIGAAGVARELSTLLDAPLFLQRYSRLVYDCNRAPENPGAMPERSEVFDIPGNRNLASEQKFARITEIYRPFLNTITAFLDRRAATNTRAIPISIHSFTPTYFGKARDVEVGLLFEHHDGLAKALAQSFPDHHTQLNEPYGPEHGVMHLMNQIAAPRSLAHLMLEIRNDLINDDISQKQWAQRLYGALTDQLINT